MKKLLKYIPLVIVSMLLVSTTVLAYTYSTPITVTENASVSYEMLPLIASVGNVYLVDNDYIHSTGLDTRILKVSTELPHMLTNDKTLFCSAVNAGEQTGFAYTFGNALKSAFHIITGYNGYVTVSDDPSLELGDNFTVEQSGYVDTSAGADKNLVYKQDAFRTYVSGAGSITSSILGTANATINPDSTGNYTAIANVVGAATHWEAVSDANDATYVNTSNTTQEKDAYNLGTPSFSGISQTINSVTAHFRYSTSNSTNTVYVQPYLRLSSTETTGTEVSHTGDTNWQDASEILVRPGGGTWTVADFADLQVAVGLRGSNSTDLYYKISKVYVVIDYDYVNVSVTATGVSSGEHTVKTTYDGAILRILIDGVKNLLYNGDFEVGDPPTGWGAQFCSIAQESTIVKLGSHSLKIHTSNTNYSNSYAAVPNYTSYVGKTVTFGAWCRAPSTNVKSQVLAVSARAGYVSWSDIVPKDDAWHWMTATRTIESQATYLRGVAYVCAGVFDVGDILYVDGAIMVEGDTISQTPPVPESVAFVGSVPDNSYDWIIMQNNCIAYMEYMKIATD